MGHSTHRTRRWAHGLKGEVATSIPLLAAITPGQPQPKDTHMPGIAFT